MVNPKIMMKAYKFWEETRKFRAVPDELKEYEKEIMNRQRLYRDKGTLTPEGLQRLRRDIITEIGKEKGFWEKTGVKIGIVVGIITIISFIVKHFESLRNFIRQLSKIIFPNLF